MVSDKKALWQLFDDKSGRYEVRTRHFNDNGRPVYINELIKESSPYLLQHAHNPVNWVAWDETAFEQAKAQNKPIFMSVGYATCHWCHVMEHESFEDLAVADYLNQHFICIKVDREQHPVVDDFYMTALQLIAGQGGWPMSVFLTANAEPFMAGTYFPQARFLDLLSQINDLWHEQQDKLIQQGIRVKETVTRYLSGASPESGQALSPSFYKQSLNQLSTELLAMLDEHNGGFGGAPKFPQEAWLQFFLYQHLDSNDPEVAAALKLSLKKMQQGGIHDHVAGGFHRYCVDEDWLVPHFEKMLYNQAQLLQLYSQAAVLFNESSFAETAKQVVAFLEAEMLSEQGLFYSALDADSQDEQGQMVEGAFYVWSWSELKDLLNKEELKYLKTHFTVCRGGNFEGKNVLYQRDVNMKTLQSDCFSSIFSRIKEKLKSARLKKFRPLTDDKIIVSWNAMMIESLARASVLLNDLNMLSLAESSYAHLSAVHQHNDQLWRVSLSGKRQNIAAVLSDYCNLVSAALALRDACIDDDIKRAGYEKDLRMLLVQIREKFWHQGLLYQSESAQEQQWQPKVVNAKDGATVSATAKLLQVLASIENQWPEFETWFDEVMSSHALSIDKQNTAHSSLLTAYLQRENHVFGQQLIQKFGTKVLCEKQSGHWHVSCQSDALWSLNKTQLMVDDTNIEPVKSTNSCCQFELPAQFKQVKITWELCDDKQCLPPQSMKLALY